MNDDFIFAWHLNLVTIFKSLSFFVGVAGDQTQCCVLVWHVLCHWAKYPTPRSLSWRLLCYIWCSNIAQYNSELLWRSLPPRMLELWDGIKLYGVKKQTELQFISTLFWSVWMTQLNFHDDTSLIILEWFGIVMRRNYFLGNLIPMMTWFTDDLRIIEINYNFY